MGNGVNVSKTMHGIRALLDPSMILLQTLVEVFARPMLHVIAQDAHELLVERRYGHPFITHSGAWPAQRAPAQIKPLSGLHIPFLATRAHPPGCHPHQWRERSHHFPLTLLLGSQAVFRKRGKSA